MKKLVWLVLFLLFATAACSSSGELQVTEVWGRPSPTAAANGAFYMVIANGTNEDDALTAVETEACGMAELHESFMKDDGVMGMRPMPNDEIPIPAGETIELKVGGMHVMCMHKTAAFVAGDKIPLTLTFTQAGEMEVVAEIREN